jgi:hypothetical protein
MDIKLQDGGQVWLNEQAPHWKEWRGKQAYKFYAAEQRAKRLRAEREAASDET